MTKRLKKLLYLALFTGCAIVSSCEKPEQVGSDVDSRISALEDRVSVLETIVNASENGDLITSVTPLIENGLLIGYVIEFQKGAPITVYCGKDGLNGSNGTDGSNGKDGDSMFKSVTVTDAEVVFVTSDGHSFVVRRAMALRIEFDSADLVVMGTNLTRDIHYSITSETDDIEIEALSSADIKVKVVKIDAKTGTLNVKTGPAIDDYSKVVVLVSNGSQAIMRTLCFEEEAIEVEENTTKEVSDLGGEVTLGFFSNVPCHAVIPEDAQSWIGIASGTKSLTKQSVVLTVAPNQKALRRATVTVTTDDGRLRLTYNIEQKYNRDFQLALERDALVALYNATNGDSWHHEDMVDVDVRENWCTDKAVSSWYGVSCNSEGLVTDLHLPFSYLDGYIPSELGNLSELEGLSLGQKLHGNIPESLSRLKRLESLQLRGDNLNGNIPDFLSQLTNLRCLIIEGGKITGTIPESFTGLEKLETLDLSNNCLSGTIPEYVGSIKKLKDLRLRNNRFTGTIPTSLMNLQRLESLCLGYNYLSGEIPDDFFEWDVWKSQWGKCLDGNLYHFEDIVLPGPTFNVNTIDNRNLVSSDVYASHKYTILFQWTLLDAPLLGGFIDELKDIKAKYGNQITVVSWVLSYYDKSNEALAFFNEKGIPGDFFYMDLNNLGQGGHEAGTYPANEPYPGNGSISTLTVVDNAGKIVLSDVFDSKVKPCVDKGSELMKWLESTSQAVTPGYYCSTDYSMDGKLSVLQRSAFGKGPSLIIIGDGFSDRQQYMFDNSAEKAYNAFFSKEPLASYRNCFNVFKINAVSKNELFEEGCETALSCSFGDGVIVSGNDRKCMWYSFNAGIDPTTMDECVILVLINANRYAGTCYMYDCFQGDWGQGLSVAYVPLYNDEGYYFPFSCTVVHEAGGHGFAKLKDEYYYDGNEINPEWIPVANKYALYGWYKNIDFTSDHTKVKWAQFLQDERYENEGLGCFEGAAACSSGIWRPSQNSIMGNDNGGFNAPSRFAIWYRIGKLTYGEDWEGSYEDFVAYDAVNRTPAANAESHGKSNRSMIERHREPLAPPVVVGRTWREEMSK